MQIRLQLLQNSPLAKHSQYSLRHCDFVQLHGFRGFTPVDSKISGIFSITGRGVSIVVVTTLEGSIFGVTWSIDRT